MSSPAIISHNLKELLRIHILKAFKNLKDLNQSRSHKPGLYSLSAMGGQLFTRPIPQNQGFPATERVCL